MTASPEIRERRKTRVIEVMEKHHTWTRIDTGIARCLQCSCGFKASGYTWKDVDEQVAKHEAAVEAANSSSESR